MLLFCILGKETWVPVEGSEDKMRYPFHNYRRMAIDNIRLHAPLLLFPRLSHFRKSVNTE